MKTQRWRDSFLPRRGEKEDPGGPGEGRTWLFVGSAAKELGATGQNCPAVGTPVAPAEKAELGSTPRGTRACPGSLRGKDLSVPHRSLGPGAVLLSSAASGAWSLLRRGRRQLGGKERKETDNWDSLKGAGCRGSGNRSGVFRGAH